jgi:hypothetical protein
MTQLYVEGEPAAELLRRRWFAAVRAAKTAQQQCETLLGSMLVAEAAWQQARNQWSDLENLRDALGEELATLDERDEMAESDSAGYGVRSAA